MFFQQGLTVPWQSATACLTPSFLHPFRFFNLDLPPFVWEYEEAYFIIYFEQTVCECLLNLTLERLQKYILYSFLTQKYITDHKSYFKLIFIKRKYKVGSYISLRKKVKWRKGHINKLEDIKPELYKDLEDAFSSVKWANPFLSSIQWDLQSV